MAVRPTIDSSQVVSVKVQGMWESMSQNSEAGLVGHKIRTKICSVSEGQERIRNGVCKVCCVESWTRGTTLLLSNAGCLLFEAEYSECSQSRVQFNTCGCRVQWRLSR